MPGPAASAHRMQSTFSGLSRGAQRGISCSAACRNAAGGQRLTLAQISAQRKHFLWNRVCILGGI